VLNVLISTPVFVLAWLWSIKCGVEVGWALGPVSRSSGGGNGEASRVVGGIDRHSGVRAVSMGLMQGRRRAPFTSGGSSVGADSQRE
jgi:alpha-1,3-glucosyltransferase